MAIAKTFFQRDKENMWNLVVSNVPAGGIAPSGARTYTGTVTPLIHSSLCVREYIQLYRKRVPIQEMSYKFRVINFIYAN